MRAPVSWLREFVAIPSDQDGRAIAEKLINAGLEVETVETLGAGVIGPLVVGHVVGQHPPDHHRGAPLADG